MDGLKILFTIVVLLLWSATFFYPVDDFSAIDLQTDDSSSNLSEQLQGIINFPRIIHLSQAILGQSRRYSMQSFEFAPLLLLNSSLLETARLRDWLVRLQVEAQHLAPLKYPSNKPRSFLFYLKSHKTGSSTLNGIVWRSFCLFNSSLNCFLPSLTNPGQTFDRRDIENIINTIGTRHNTQKQFDVWNSHIRINYFTSLDRYGERNSADEEEQREAAFSRLFFDKIAPHPRYFLSIVRRPAHRFESAFHWYELKELYQWHLKEMSDEQYAQSGIETFLSRPSDIISPSSKKLKGRLKNRLNRDKLLANHDLPVAKPRTANELTDFIEDIAFAILQRIQQQIESKCPSYRFDHVCHLAIIGEDWSVMSKEAIDSALLSFEQMFHHRSGFQSMSKELLGIDQFRRIMRSGKRDSQSNFSQKKFEHYFKQLLLHLQQIQSLTSAPSALSWLFLLNVDDFDSSLATLRTALNLNGAFPLLYLPRKQQHYQKLAEHDSSHLHYEFLDLLQYYDLILYETQKIWASHLEQTFRITTKQKNDFKKARLVLQEKCSPYALKNPSISDIEFRQVEQIWQKLQRLDDDKLLSYLFLFIEEDWKILCKVFQMDNFDYVQFFHRQQGK